MDWKAKFSDFKKQGSFYILEDRPILKDPIWKTLTIWSIDRTAWVHHLLSTEDPDDPEEMCHKMYELVFPCLGTQSIDHHAGTFVDVSQFMDSKFERRKKLVCSVLSLLMIWGGGDDGGSSDRDDDDYYPNEDSGDDRDIFKSREAHPDEEKGDNLYGYQQGDRLLLILVKKIGIKLNHTRSLVALRLEVIDILSGCYSPGSLADCYRYILELVLQLVLVMQEETILETLRNIIAVLFYYMIEISETFKFDIHVPNLGKKFLNKFWDMVTSQESLHPGELYLSNLLGFTFVRNQFYLTQNAFSIKLIQSIPLSDVGVRKMIDIAGVHTIPDFRIDREYPQTNSDVISGISSAVEKWLGTNPQIKTPLEEGVTLECLKYLIENYSYCGPGRVPVNKVTITDLLKRVETDKITRLILEEDDPSECQRKYAQFKTHEIKFFKSFLDKHLKPLKKSKLLLLSAKNTNKTDLGPIFSPDTTARQMMFKMYEFINSHRDDPPENTLETITNAVNLFHILYSKK